MKWKRIPLGAILVALLISGAGMGQNLDALAERFSGPNAAPYFKPLVSGAAAGLNAGLFYSARIPRGGLHIDIRLNGMAATFSEDQRTFTASTDGDFSPASSVETPTVIGDGTGAVVTGAGGSRYVFPGGYDLDALGLVAPTVTLGSLWGTEMLVRFVDIRINEDIGNLDLLGLGIRHSLSQYWSDGPLAVSAGVAWHRFRLGDLVDMDLYTAHIEAGRAWSVFDVYGGLSLGGGGADLEYTFTANGEELPVDISIDTGTQVQAVVGGTINLLMLHLNADYRVGSQNLLCVGVSLGL